MGLSDLPALARFEVPNTSRTPRVFNFLGPPLEMMA
jgi:hypothetical protein